MHVLLGQAAERVIKMYVPEEWGDDDVLWGIDINRVLFRDVYVCHYSEENTL